MSTHWEVNCAKLASRVLFQRPAHYLPETVLQQHVRERIFPDRKHAEEHQIMTWLLLKPKCNELRRLAARNETENPVSFAIGNSWNDTLRADKQHHLEIHYTKLDIASFLPLPPLAPGSHPLHCLSVLLA